MGREMTTTDTMADRMRRVHNVSHDVARLGVELLANVHSEDDLALARTYRNRLVRAVNSLDAVITEAELLRAELEAPCLGDGRCGEPVECVCDPNGDPS
jgi:hypothetical protein